MVIQIDSPGHFCCADRCEFFLHHHVGQYCISTVGEFRETPDGIIVNVSLFHKYETMVFDLTSDARWYNIDCEYSDTREQAFAVHDAMIEKYSND